MSSLSDSQLAELQYHLQNAVQGCIDRCLYQSAKWWVAFAHPKTSTITSNSNSNS
jgi:hypothetical protein